MTACYARNGLGWPCHFDNEHPEDHAFTDADEIAILRKRVAAMEKDLEYFRSAPTLAQYTQALKDEGALKRIEAVIESHSPCGEDVPADALRKALER